VNNIHSSSIILCTYFVHNVYVHSYPIGGSFGSFFFLGLTPLVCIHHYDNEEKKIMLLPTQMMIPPPPPPPRFLELGVCWTPPQKKKNGGKIVPAATIHDPPHILICSKNNPACSTFSSSHPLGVCGCLWTFCLLLWLPWGLGLGQHHWRWWGNRPSRYNEEPGSSSTRIRHCRLVGRSLLTHGRLTTASWPRTVKKIHPRCLREMASRSTHQPHASSPRQTQCRR